MDLLTIILFTYIVTQVLRGVAAVPEAIIAPRQGKWWNEASHEWIHTDLSKVDVPQSDDDLLGGLESELDAAGELKTGAGAVKDTYYYDMLEVRKPTDSFIEFLFSGVLLTTPLLRHSGRSASGSRLY